MGNGSDGRAGQEPAVIVEVLTNLARRRTFLESVPTTHAPVSGLLT